MPDDQAVRTSETSVDNYFTRQYIPEDNSEHKLKFLSTLLIALHASLVYIPLDIISYQLLTEACGGLTFNDILKGVKNFVCG
jgi:hypothetical protein